ncbi:MAG: radical SAM protein [Thermodesulfobacteriota bacterium]
MHNNKTAGRPRRVFGPVPSRRLGLSLGLDLVPAKTCTLDCLYCEIGRTTVKTLERRSWNMADELEAELAGLLPECEARLDYVTLAGSGEPTLNLELGSIIERVKRLTEVPLAVLTNGTLLSRPDVRRDLAGADLVIPSLDSALEDTFRRLNRPAAGLDLSEYIEGLIAFRQGYKGRVWLEILLVSGVNDGPEELAALKAVVDRLEPDLVQLNTVYRPPAYDGAKALSAEALAGAADFFGPLAEPVTAFKRGRNAEQTGETEKDILALLARRPCTAQDVSHALGLDLTRVLPLLRGLTRSGRVLAETHNRETFYRRV